jgi:aminopeptidase N
VEVDVVGDRTEVPELAGRRRPDLLLVNDDDLAYSKIRLDEHSFETGAHHLDAFADSMPRSLVLGAAWDMTRDAESPARSFLELVLRAMSTETDSTGLRLLLAQLSTTVRLYVAPEHRATARRRASESLHELAAAAEPGSDRQLQLVTAFAAHATSPEQVALVRGLLDGSTTFDGLAVDTDMRWSLLTSLVAAGGAGEDEIAAELRRDATADGQRAAAAARAAVPTPEAKAAAWASVVESDELPNAVTESVIHGFSRVQDPELLRPYVKPYFAAIERIWSTRTNEIAQQVVVGLYPTALADQELLEMSDAWLESTPDAVPALRRLVSENRDAVARALRVQARDHES